MIKMSHQFMLSFTQGTPVALALDKKGKIIHTIHVTRQEKLPDIDVDNVLELIDQVDIDQVKRALHLGMIETRVLTKAIQKQDSSGLSEPIKRAFDVLEGKAHGKLKTEIQFDRDSEVDSVIPLIGQGDRPFDRSIVFIGPSGSGKSFLARQILEHDLRKRRIVLFSKVIDDPSLRPLTTVKSFHETPRLIQLPLFTDEDLANIPPDSDLACSICMFDDIDAFSNEKATFLRDFRDNLLEAGRHKGITVFSTSHILGNYNKTRTILNEAEWVVLYPPANRRSADLFLKDRMGMVKQERDFLISRSGSSGRYLAVKMSCPNLMLHRKGILLL